jgi:hypothetical protein
MGTDFNDLMDQEDFVDRALEKCLTIDIQLLPILFNGDFSILVSEPDMKLEQLIEEKEDLTEHIFAIYINRIIREEEVSDKIINEVLSYWNNANNTWKSIIQSFIGELAMFNKVNDIDLLDGLRQKYLEPSDWAYRQITVRKLLIENDKYDKAIIDAIIENRTAWALYEIIPGLSADILDYLIYLIKNEKILTRTHRHELKEFIRKKKNIKV